MTKSAKCKLISISFFILIVCGTTFAKANDSSIYEDTLRKFLISVVNVSQNPNQQSAIQNAKDNQDLLLDFPKKYPTSIYADDSYYLFAMIQFTGAATSNNSESVDRMISMIKQLVKLYPLGKLDDLSVKVVKEVMGEQSGGIMLCLPYSSVIDYMNGFAADAKGDFETSVKEYAKLKHDLSGIIQNRWELAYEIYVPLIVGYKKLGRREDLKSIAQEAARNYPNTKLGNTGTSIVNNLDNVMSK
jgi:tetratricopeptide (TPR) repeat protein